MPYVPVSGSLKMLSVGVLKVNRTKSKAMPQSNAKAHFADAQRNFSVWKSFVSLIYAAAAEIKKMPIFIQSGDFPITPL